MAVGRPRLGQSPRPQGSRSRMTMTAVPKCQPFATTLWRALSSLAGAVKSSARWCIRSFTRMLGVTSSPRSFSHRFSLLKCHGANCRPASSQRWKVAESSFPFTDLGAGRPSGPGAGVVSVGSVLPSARHFGGFHWGGRIDAAWSGANSNDRRSVSYSLVQLIFHPRTSSLNCDHPASVQKTRGLFTSPQSWASKMTPGTPVSESK